MRTTGRGYNDSENPTLPGLRDHPSAEQSKVKQRNAEYNEFLRAQEEKLRHRFDEKKGQSPQAPPQVGFKC